LQFFLINNYSIGAKLKLAGDALKHPVNGVGKRTFWMFDNPTASNTHQH